MNPPCQGAIIITVSPWHFILVVLAGWVHREQLKVIEYLRAENRALREKLGNKRIRFTDEQRRRLAVKGHALGRKALHELGERAAKARAATNAR